MSNSISNLKEKESQMGAGEKLLTLQQNTDHQGSCLE
jgi:hypothetical protein